MSTDYKYNDKELATVRHYIAGGMENQTEAYAANYKTAGVSRRTLTKRANDFFKKPKIGILLDQERARVSCEFVADAATVKKMAVRAATVAFQETHYERQGVKVVKQMDPQTGLKALDMINKMDGNYAPERKELTGADGGPIKTRTLSDFYDDLAAGAADADA